MEANIDCMICYKHAKDAVNCANFACNKLFCQKCYWDIMKTESEAKCPYCRITPFISKVTQDRDRINSTQIKCKLCKNDVRLDKIQKHEKKLCQFIKITCKFCMKTFSKKDISHHTKSTHADKIQDILIWFHEKNTPLVEPNEVLQIKSEKNQIKEGKKPNLGKTGKFYCGEKLETACFCCNGYCGPTTGQNCSQCMKLDQIRLGLKKGQLVNANGKISWLEDGEFICGTMYSEERRQCGEVGTCQWCRNMTKNMGRYKNLL